MKTLYLLRHAKSSWKHQELTDHERPLNKRGKRDAPRIGKWLAENIEKPDLIITSDSIRTLSTVSKVAKELGVKGENIIDNHRLYHAPASSIWHIVKNCSDEINSLMLVGHNPGFNEFINQLTPNHQIENLPTCGVYAVAFDVDSWQQIKPKAANFLFFQYPKKLED